MTYYIAAYDTESPGCLDAVRRIVQVHRELAMPATFFLVGRVLEADADEYRDLLGDGLFEAASHTWSHRTLIDHPFCGPAAPDDAVREEVLRGKEAVERVFGRDCVGLRPGCGFTDGLRGRPKILGWVAEAGYRYTSSQLWGPDYSMPAPLDQQPFTYAEEGFPDLWELPGHGWQDNVLKDHTGWGPRRLVLWPPVWPEGVPPGFVRTVREEVEVNAVFLQAAIRRKATFVSLIWHPWSLRRFDPDMAMLRMTFERVRRMQLQPCTYEQLWRRCADQAPGEA